MTTWIRMLCAAGAVPLLVAGTAGAQTVAAYGPSSLSGTYVKSTTTYFCDPAQSVHNAMDICIDTTGLNETCGGCKATNVRAMLDGSYFYKLEYDKCEDDCDETPTKCGGGAGNYYAVEGANGYAFRQLHLIRSPDLLSKTAVRGSFLGWWGSTGSSTAPHVHADNRQYKTRLTAWYTGYVTCGSPATSANTVGQVKLR